MIEDIGDPAQLDDMQYNELAAHVLYKLGVLAEEPGENPLAGLHVDDVDRVVALGDFLLKVEGHVRGRTRDVAREGFQEFKKAMFGER